MLSIKKNLGLLAMTAALAACASNPNDLPDFPEHEYAATQQVGEGVINGDLYLTSASGAIQKGTNTKVTLEPATSYMKAYYAKFGNLDAAKRDPDVQPPVLDPRRATYVREATTDQNGRFDFDHIPNGTYYISSELTWSAQSDGKTITEGGTVTKLVTVSGSQPQKVLLTRCPPAVFGQSGKPLPSRQGLFPAGAAGPLDSQRACAVVSIPMTFATLLTRRSIITAIPAMAG